MPTQIDGYDIYAIRNSYFAWIAQRMGRAREVAQELAPLPQELRRSTRGREGLRIQVVNVEYAGEYFGSELRLSERCAVDRPCLWLARRTQVRLASAADFLRDHFDAARAVAYLREHAVEPTQVRDAGPQSYGLDDPMATPLAFVDVRDATAATCPGIDQALAVAGQRMRALHVDSAQPRHSNRPPPPALHAYLSVVTLPSWYVHDRSGRVSEGELTLSGRGDPLIDEMIAAIESPLRGCGL